MNKNKYPKITVVTPSFNQVDYIEDCIQSVLNQNYPNLEYIIIDGGSCDGTINVIEKYKKHITFFISERDTGQYNAINKGFNHASGKYLTWLNSDDMFKKNTLLNISEILIKYPQIDWITGAKMFYSSDGEIELVANQIPYYSTFIRMGFYVGNLFGWIQQEGTFWSKDLWMKAGPLRENLFYASDFCLWKEFAKYSNLFTVNTIFAGNRHHSKQKTEKLFGAESYIQEALSTNYKLFKFLAINRFTAKIIQNVSKCLPAKNIINFDTMRKDWFIEK